MIRVVLAALLTMTAFSLASPARAAATEYYMSLGDSLSAGVQPDAAGDSVPTDEGYADQLYALLQSSNPGLVQHKLGCPGETTTTLMDGGICGYSGGDLTGYSSDTGSQLAAALAFLRTHPGQVPLITIDIGANDIDSCLSDSTLAIPGCLAGVFPVVQRNLSAVLARLRAADPSAVIVGMTYYDPDLQSWQSGLTGQLYALASIPVTLALRDELSSTYETAGAYVADVYTSFQTGDLTDQMTLPDGTTVPEDVGRICQWTWMCAAAPRGPNIHADTIGYEVIAKTFLAALGHIATRDFSTRRAAAHTMTPVPGR